MASPVRLRQVALVARDLELVTSALETALAVRDPFVDPGVAEFGLRNAVYAVGDTFLEVVSPTVEGTTAGRYLDKRGGDGGYMAIFQVPDSDAARARAAAQGVRTVWQIDLADISGTHFHPKDVPGAIVSVDTPAPPETWRWAGPAWTGHAPPHDARQIAGVTVECDDPERAAAIWGGLLDVAATGTELAIDGGRQTIGFRSGTAGIVAVAIRGLAVATQVGGVMFQPG